MAQPEPEKLKAYLGLIFGSLGGAMTSAMISLGDRLGLYRVLAERGALSSAELAAATGLKERWLREWLYQQGAAGVLEHKGEERFALSAEGEAVLADEGHPAFGAGFFAHLPQTLGVVEKLPEAFRSGVGLPYDAFGPEGAAGIERGFAPWFRTVLVPMAIPRLPGVADALRRGGAAADVGCHDARSESLPGDASLDFVSAFDCLHDMAHPERALAAVRQSLRPDGVFLICDIKARDSFAENVRKNPMAAMMYGTSVLTCMSSALSEADGLGLGTLGFPESLARKMCAEAGFSHFEPIDFGHPVNAFYVVRP